MNNLKYLITVFICLTVLSAAIIYLYANDNVTTLSKEDTLVVASFYPVYVAAENLVDGVDGITLKNLSEPQTGCLHDYVLTPEDMKLLSDADVFVINGGGIEAFLSEVAEAYPALTVVDAGINIEKASESDENGHAHDHDDEENAHYWMSIPLYEQQIEAMRDGLCAYFSTDKAVSQKDGSNRSPDDHTTKIATQITDNASAYLSALQDLQSQQADIAEKLAGQKVILFHEAYEYVAEDYGLEVAYLLDLDEERQVSAGEIADVMQAIEENGVSLILAEEQYGKELGDLVSEETGADVIYLDTIVRGGESDHPDAYLTRMQNNIDLLANYAAKNKP